MLTLWTAFIGFILYFHHVKGQPRLATTALTTKAPYNSIGLLLAECYNTASSTRRRTFFGTGTIINSALDGTKTYDYILTAASNIWRAKSKPQELCDNFYFFAGLNQPLTAALTSLTPALATHKPADIDRIWMQEYILSPKAETNYAIIRWYRLSSAPTTLQPLTINVEKAISGSGEIAAYDTTTKTGALTTKSGSVRFTAPGKQFFVQLSAKLFLPTDAIGGALVTNKKLIGILVAVGKTKNKYRRIDQTVADHVNKVISKTLEDEFTFSAIDVARFGVDYVEWNKQAKPVKQKLMRKYPFKATGLLVHHCSYDYKTYLKKTKSPRPKPRPRPEAVGVGSIIKSVKESDGNVYDYVLTVGHNVWVTTKAFGRGAHKEQLCTKYEFYLGLNEKDLFIKSDFDTKRATLMTHDSAGVQEIYLPYYDGEQRGKVGRNFDDEKYYDWAVIKWKKKVNRVSDVLVPTYYTDWQKTYGTTGTPLKTLIATYDPFNGRPQRDYDPFGSAYRAKTGAVEVKVESSNLKYDFSKIWIHKLRKMFARPGMSGSPLVLIDDKPSREGSRKQIGILAAVDKRTKGEAKYLRITETFYKDIMDILDGKRKPDFTTGFLAHEDIQNYYAEGEMMDDMADENEALYQKWMNLELIMLSALVICCGCIGFGCGLLSMYAFKIVNK